MDHLQAKKKDTWIIDITNGEDLTIEKPYSILKRNISTNKELKTFRSFLSDMSLSNNTVNKLMIQMKELLDAIVRNWALKENPYK